MNLQNNGDCLDLFILVQVLAFEAGRKNRIRVNTISAGNFSPQFSISFLSFLRKYNNPIGPKVRAPKEYNWGHRVQ